MIKDVITSVESEVQYGSTAENGVASPTEINKEQDCASQQQSAAEIQSATLQSLTAAASALTAEEVAYREMVDKCLITIRKMYPEKEYVVRVKGIPTLSVGDLQMIQAQAKQGKTTLVTIFVAAILAGKWGVVEYALEKAPKVVIFDTEQFECDTYRQYQTIMQLGGMAEEQLERLSIYNLRGLNFDERRKFIDNVIRKEKPLLVVIDGIRDLVPDINEPVECPQLVQELMQLASEVKCAILSVLHNNPNEGKARGWLGTEYINKCGYSFEVQKSGSIVTVKNTIYRGAPVPDWQFTFASDGQPIADESIVQHFAQLEAEKKSHQAAEARAVKEKEHLDIVVSVLKEHDNEYSRAQLVDIIDKQNINGFKRSTIHDFIKSHLKLNDRGFDEVNGKMKLTENWTQAELPLGD